MIDNILGIDLGTSSVKLIYSKGRETVKVRESYDEESPEGWWRAICRSARQLDLRGLRAVGLSSQVGTYVTDGGECISWQDSAGREELDFILSKVGREEFIREISMPHPVIVSYPLPRLMYIKKKWRDTKSVCMPKDLLCERLTGSRVTDAYSWRGLADLEKGRYSERLMERFGLSELCLPPILSPFAEGGRVTERAAEECGIPVGIPVFVGCNDFFSGLIGMGVSKAGDTFDITGTSEHIGVIRGDIPKESDGLVCGPYFFGNAHYGVTASGGQSLDLARELKGEKTYDPYLAVKGVPPIFLPYVNGERAPIWDGDARGVFFGIEKGCGRDELAYSVAEGVAFSIYHIYECMGYPPADCIITAGGAGIDPVLNKIKSSLFGIPIKVSAEKDVSALGAVICAAVGLGEYDCLMEANCGYTDICQPDSALRKSLLPRYEIYKRLYPELRESFGMLKELRK